MQCTREPDQYPGARGSGTFDVRVVLPHVVVRNVIIRKPPRLHLVGLRDGTRPLGCTKDMDLELSVWFVVERLPEYALLLEVERLDACLCAQPHHQTPLATNTPFIHPSMVGTFMELAQSCITDRLTSFDLATEAIEDALAPAAQLLAQQHLIDARFLTTAEQEGVGEQDDTTCTLERHGRWING